MFYLTQTRVWYAEYDVSRGVEVEGDNVFTQALFVNQEPTGPQPSGARPTNTLRSKVNIKQRTPTQRI